MFNCFRLHKLCPLHTKSLALPKSHSKEMEGSCRKSPSSMPLVSRLDHLDFIMKYLEGKRHLQKGVGKQQVPLDSAVKDAYFKGSLLDRVAALEQKLFQLCLALESSGTSSMSTATSGYASSSQGSRGEPSCSLPTFSNSFQGHKQEPRVTLVNRTEIQQKSQAVQQRKKNPSSAPKQQLVNKKSSRDEKTSKTRKKGVSPKWTHLRILGC